MTQKVLIADDDGINRQVLATLLKPEYVVLLAKTGEQAIERAQRHLPDLLMEVTGVPCYVAIAPVIPRLT